jgi:mono/diheme cytochrome c family protein
MKRELFALSVVVFILILFPAAVFGYQAARTRSIDSPVIEIVAKAPDAGGFVPDRLRLVAGETVTLRISSPDVVHGFSIPGLGIEIDDIYPGKPVDVQVTPQQPGRYTYACTRWCGVDHWRMRGVIEVIAPKAVSGLRPSQGEQGAAASAQAAKPLYERLGIDLDAMRHDATLTPVARPSASRGAALGSRLPDDASSIFNLQSSITPADAFRQLRASDATAGLSDDQVWDAVAWAWLKDMPAERLARAEYLYARDCAACHGETGRGDGIAGKDLPGMAKMDPAMPAGPADFTDAKQMLAASDVMLQGKLLRGGMGTGMPEFGSLYTEEEQWAMITYLRTFVFDR